MPELQYNNTLLSDESCLGLFLVGDTLYFVRRIRESTTVSLAPSLLQSRRPAECGHKPGQEREGATHHSSDDDAYLISRFPCGSPSSVGARAPSPKACPGSHRTPCIWWRSVGFEPVVILNLGGKKGGGGVWCKTSLCVPVLPAVGIDEAPCCQKADDLPLGLLHLDRSWTVTGCHVVLANRNLTNQDRRYPPSILVLPRRRKSYIRASNKLRREFRPLPLILIMYECNHRKYRSGVSLGVFKIQNTVFQGLAYRRMTCRDELRFKC